MTFFNKKEEVLDIKLTQYGKEQLAKGKLKPKYYSFFDDDILYDSQYAGFTEDQSEIEPRIQRDTPSLRTQAMFESVEFTRQTVEVSQRTADKHYSLTSPLGSSTLANQYRPAWDVKFLKGEVSSSLNYSTGSHQPVPIPQLDVDVTYKTIVRDSSDDNGAIDDVIQGLDNDIFLGDESILLSRVFEDGTYIEVLQEQVLIDVFEDNTEFDMQNVEIEFFEIEMVDVKGTIQNLGSSAGSLTKKEVLKPLKFKPKVNNVQNNILMPELTVDDNMEIDSSYVEYYLDVLVDHEIPNELMCKSIQKIRSRGVDIDTASLDFECSEVKEGQPRIDIYGSNISEDVDPGCEDIESCQD